MEEKLNEHGVKFGDALEALKEGKKVTRTEWNKDGIFVFMIDGFQATVDKTPFNRAFDAGTRIDVRPHIYLSSPDKIVLPWAPSQTDLLAEDWIIYH